MSLVVQCFYDFSIEELFSQRAMFCFSFYVHSCGNFVISYVTFMQKVMQITTRKQICLNCLSFQEHPNSPLGFSRVRVAPSLVFCGSLFVLFLLSIVFVLLRFTASEPMFIFFCCCFCFVICVFLVAIALCVLRFTASNYPLGII